MNSPGLRTYEHIYGVGLLDDLHNYFPALLYEHNRLHSVSSVFHYVRSQMNRRFNLYQYGASMYHSTEGEGMRVPSVVIPPTPLVQPRVAEPSTPTPAPTVIREVDPHLRQMGENPLGFATRDPLSSVLSAQMLLNLFDLAVRAEGDMPEVVQQNPPLTRRILQPRRTTPLGRFDGIGFSPVVVRPTAESIARGTEELLGSQIPEHTVCTICQDTITTSNTTLVRKIRYCSHFYHRGCIDEWFTRSVFCPTCRHDIRE